MSLQDTSTLSDRQPIFADSVIGVAASTTPVQQDLFSSGALLEAQHKAEDTFEDTFEFTFDYADSSAPAPVGYREEIEARYFGPEGTFSQAVSFGEDLGRNEDLEFLGKEFKRFAHSVKRHNHGVIAGFHNEDGSIWQFRSEFPEADANGKVAKYKSPAGVNRLFRPHYAGSMLLRGELRHDVVVLVEGGLKAHACAGAGFDAISAYGCQGFVKKVQVGELVEYKLHPELLDLIGDRQVIFALDEDEKPSTRETVKRAKIRAAKLLAEAGVVVNFAKWSPEIGKAPDDIIQIERDRLLAEGASAEEALEGGRKKLAAVLGTARPRKIVSTHLHGFQGNLFHGFKIAEYDPADWAKNAIKKQIETRVTQEPDLTVEVPITEIVDHIPWNGAVAMQAHMGGGKTTAVAKLLDMIEETTGERNFVSINGLQSLARNQAERFGGVFLNDANGEAEALTCCVPSLTRVVGTRKILILDEVTQVFDFLATSALVTAGRGQNARRDAIEVLKALIRAAELVLIMDQDLTQEALDFIAELRKESVYLIRSTVAPFSCPVEIADDLDHVRAESIGDIDYNQRNKLVSVVHADTRAEIEIQAKAIAACGGKMLCVTRQTKTDDVVQNLLLAQPGALPQLVKQGYTHLGFSPTVTVGFSFEHDTELVNKIYGVYSGKSIGATAANQSLFRVRRSNVRRIVFVANKGTTGSKLGSGFTPEDWLESYQRRCTSIASEIAGGVGAKVELSQEGGLGLSLAFDQFAEGAGPTDLWLLACLEARKNSAAAYYRYTFEALVQSAGNTVVPFDGAHSEDHIELIESLFKGAREERKAEEVAAVIAAPQISLEEFLEIKAKDNPTSAEYRAAARYAIEDFYATEINEEIAGFDSTDRRKAIRNTEKLLNPGLGLAASIHSVNANPFTTQDWDAGLRLESFIRRVGFDVVIMEIWAGRIGNSEDCPALTAIVATIRAEEAETFKDLFGANLDKVNDTYIVSKVLAAYGIKSKRQKNRKAEVNPNITPRNYEVMVVMQQAIERRAARRAEELAQAEMKAAQEQQEDQEPATLDPTTGYRIELEIEVQAQEELEHH